MCVPCFLALLFIFYTIIGIITGSIFNYKYKWKVDFKISSEKFGACWPFYIPKLIAELKAEKKQSNRNMVLYTLHDIEYEKTNVNKNSSVNVNTSASLSLVGAYLALNQKMVESPSDYLEFKGKRYMIDINGNILPLILD
jgi:hypothetical protein